MSAETADHLPEDVGLPERIERLLAEHRGIERGPFSTIFGCRCGASFQGGDVYGSRHLWERHRAQIVADFVRHIADAELMAEAWREGYERAAEDRYEEILGDPGGNSLNPYLGANG